MEAKVEIIQIGSKKYIAQNLRELDEKELANVIDFGTSLNESFQSYIIRIEKAIDLWLYIKEGMHPYILDTIMKIFEDVTTNPQAIKFPQVIQYLENTLGRTATLDDLNSLIDRTRVRLEHKILKYDRERKEGLLH